MRSDPDLVGQVVHADRRTVGEVVPHGQDNPYRVLEEQVQLDAVHPRSGVEVVLQNDGEVQGATEQPIQGGGAIGELVDDDQSGMDLGEFRVSIEPGT